MEQSLSSVEQFDFIQHYPPQNSVFNTLPNVMEEYIHLQQALTVTNITGLQPQAVNAGIFNPPHPQDNQLKHFK